MSLKPTRPTAKHSPSTGHGGANTEISVCSRCGRTVWSWQAHAWSTDRWALGIVHTDTNDCEAL